MDCSIINLLMPISHIRLLLNESSLIGLLKIDKGLNSISTLVLRLKAEVCEGLFYIHIGLLSGSP